MRPLMRLPQGLPARSGEAGSAFIAVLLVLVILTIIGLSLATISSLEMEVGSAERSLTRAFYGADSGIAVATAAALTTRDYRPRELRLFDDTRTTSGGSPALTRSYRVQLTHTVPLLVDRCNLCSANENEVQFWKVNHGMLSAANELSWGGGAADAPEDLGEANRYARKVVSVMIEAQPIWAPPTTSIDLTGTELAAIKF